AEIVGVLLDQGFESVPILGSVQGFVGASISFFTRANDARRRAQRAAIGDQDVLGTDALLDRVFGGDGRRIGFGRLRYGLGHGWHLERRALTAVRGNHAAPAQGWNEDAGTPARSTRVPSEQSAELHPYSVR